MFFVGQPGVVAWAESAASEQALGLHQGGLPAWTAGLALLLPLAIVSTGGCWLLARSRRGGPSGASGLHGGFDRLVWVLASSLTFAVLVVPEVAIRTVVLGIGRVGPEGPWRQAVVEAQVALGVWVGVMLAALAMPYLRGAVAGLRVGPRGVRRFGVVLLATVGVLAPALLGAGSVGASAAETPPACNTSSADRFYDVAAVSLVIPFNRWGNRVAEGATYVLQQDKAAMTNWHLPLNGGAGGSADDNPAADPAGNRRLRPRPLVLRANAGECVTVRFTNELDDANAEGIPTSPRASMHIQGVAYDAATSDGSAVGFNPDTTVGNTPGRNTITYHWRVPDQEGLFLFNDQGMPAGGEHDAGLSGFGLFGALAVEPVGSTWTDPRTGAVLSDAPAYSAAAQQSGELYVDADIHPPNAPPFRESVQIGQDEIPGVGLGFNFGSEPLDIREANRCLDCNGEETWLSSWPYGDPGLVKLASGLGPWYPSWSPKYQAHDDNPRDDNPEDCGLAMTCWTANVTHTNVGDPTKIRFAMSGVKETHVFHLHAHQWLAEPRAATLAGTTNGQAGDRPWKAKSQTIDSQSFGPGEGFTADLLFGSGSKPGTFGDSIYHCHLYPHFAEGFWNLLRVHDVLEDGTGTTPDGIKVTALLPLPDRPAPPRPTAANPGYPRMIPGEFGWRAPQPLDGVSEPNGLPDNPGTIVREDLSPAPRMVAGKPIPARRLAVERAVSLRHYNGAPPKPGAPFADPCPTGAREVTYDVTVLQKALVYNKAGEYNPQGRILVPTRDVPAILAGTKKAEPLFFRVNAGDCINFRLTNMLPNWVGGDAFLKLTQTNMAGEHIHLVKFDVTGSDGASNGWNYQEAAFTREQADFDRRVAAGAAPCDETGCRVPDPATWDPSTVSTRADVGQTITERWYADYELRTVFTHDHHFAAIDQNRGLFGGLIVEPRGMDFRDPDTGEYQQPINDPAHGPVCTTACTAGAAGATYDVVGPGPDDDFREYGLAIEDFVPLVTAGGDPANPADAVSPPPAPEHFPQADPGTMGINYRNAPLRLRTDKDGAPVDPAYQFSSTVFGDPTTPVLQAYEGDNVRIRLIQGSMEEGHVLMVNGIRWRKEAGDPNSPLVNSQTVGISEAFNLRVPGHNCGNVDRACIGDYLYSSAATDDTYEGMWGILRVHGKDYRGLRPLPDNELGQETTVARGPVTGEPQAPVENSRSTCPAGAPVRRYHVVAMTHDIVYNSAGDHDPHGLLYALARDEEAIRAGTKRPEPLTLRANEGDCLQVTLTNHLPADYADHIAGTDGDPTLPSEPPAGSPTGMRVSLHPQLLRYDVRTADGTAVGFNQDSTVGPGESITYHWYADHVRPGEVGATNLLDFGDLRGHRHHGLFAGLNIEPTGSTWTDPVTGKPVRSGAAADIHPRRGQAFREFTTYFQNGLNLQNSHGVALADPAAHPPTPDDPADTDAEDQGEKALNYANAPFARRLGYPPSTGVPLLDALSWARVFSSWAHGDPDTPIFRAYRGDPVRFRVLQGADKPRMESFAVSGHNWLAQPFDPSSSLVAADGGFSVGRTGNEHIDAVNGPGDWRYGTLVANHNLSGGMWGILRTYRRPTATFLRSDVARTDNPYRHGYRPIRALDVPTLVRATAAPRRWVTRRGYTNPRLAALSVNDQRYQRTWAVHTRRGYLADGTGRIQLPADQQRVHTMTLTYDGGAAGHRGRRSLWLYNRIRHRWQRLAATPQPLTDRRTRVTIAHHPRRYMSPHGMVRFRVRVTSSRRFALKQDLTAVTWRYRS